MKNTYHYYYSIQEKYGGCRVHDLRLNIKHHNYDCLEIELINLRYEQKCRKILQRTLIICSFFTFYIGYIMLQNGFNVLHENKFIYPGILFIFLMLQMLLSALSIIKSEKLLLSQNTALQLKTFRALYRSTHCSIPSQHIHDVVINEVIENLDVRYLLIVRTKGKLFNERPIIPLFKHSGVPIECLQVVYRLLNLHLSRDNVGDAI